MRELAAQDINLKELLRVLSAIDNTHYSFE